MKTVFSAAPSASATCLLSRLELEPALSGELRVEDQARGAVRERAGEERLRRGERLDGRADRAEQAREALADVLVVVDHAHERGVVAESGKRLSVHDLDGAKTAGCRSACVGPSSRLLLRGANAMS
jgi:hypothetical protein